MNPQPPTPNHRPLFLVAIIGLTWLLMMGGDWYLRFRWFRWQETFVSRPLSLPPPSDPRHPPLGPSLWGGDLTRLLGVRSVAKPFEEYHPGLVDWRDEHGNRNKPPTVGIYYPIVTVGDSFMENGGRYEELFFNRLADVSGLPVYNHAATGRGSFLGLLRLLASKRFFDSPPRVVVWGILEREIRGDHFVGLVERVESGVWTEGHAAPRAVMRWDPLLPCNLKRSLPDSSAIAQVAARVWNLARTILFGQINPMVVLSPGSREPMLFYAPSLTAARWGAEVRDIPRVAWAISRASEVLASRGVRLVAVLIPDKEQVYRDRLPDSVDSIPRSCLYDLEAALGEKRVPVVNLLEPFRAEAGSGRLLYWRDDTHWNSAGIDFAVRLTWREIREMVE